MEVRLLDHAVLDGHALVQNARKPVGDGALDVGLSRGGLHDHAAVDCHPDFVHLDLARCAIERDLDRAGAERARALGDRDPERPAVRPLGLVIGHLRQGLEHLACLGRGAHALDPEVDRIDALVGGDLVDHALDREGVEHVADRAPMLELDAVRDAAPLEVLVRHAVVGDLDPGDQQEHAVADDAVLPARHLAGGVGRRLQALERLRTEHALGVSLIHI